MGTRADFYMGRGRNAEWLGSIAMDGYPDGIPVEILEASNDKEFKAEISTFLASKDYASHPSDGWPWPWDDSCTTDYAYAFDGGEVYISFYGCGWCKSAEYSSCYEFGDVKSCEFPNMSSVRNVATGKRSGLIVVYGCRDTDVKQGRGGVL